MTFVPPSCPAAWRLDRGARVATERVDAGDPFLRHKTTRRLAYERAFAAAEVAGCSEAIFLDREASSPRARAATSLFSAAGPC